MVRKSIILFLMMIFIVLCYSNTWAEESCKDCHTDVALSGTHKDIQCISCHPANVKHFEKNTLLNDGAKNCLKCHEEYTNNAKSNIHSKDKEKNLINKIFKNHDKNFYENNCSNCHVKSCTDCHSFNVSIHDIKLPNNNTCLSCHNSNFVGLEYKGLGIRDDHERYDRGPKYLDKHYMNMQKDIHAEKGLNCADCHDMKSISNAKKSSKSCTDCHTAIDKSVIEHSIPEHLNKMECYTCHSAWAPMQFGTFWIRMQNSSQKKYFRWLIPQQGEYIRSSYFNINESPPIGINNKGKYSPIKPQFQYFYTSIKNNKVRGEENELLAAKWKAVFPHTIRRETILCGNCHDNKKKFLHQTDEERIFILDKDGLKLRNFYNYESQEMLNGRFVNDTELKKILTKSDLYKKLFIKKQKKLEQLFND